MTDTPFTPQPDQVANAYKSAVALIRQGRSITAIQSLKAAFGLGIMETKLLVEAISESIVVPVPAVLPEGWVAETLVDPDAVHVNMLRGTIAKPSLRQYLHAVGDGALEAFEHVIEIAGRNEAAPSIEKAKQLLLGPLAARPTPPSQDVGDVTVEEVAYVIGQADLSCVTIDKDLALRCATAVLEHLRTHPTPARTDGRRGVDGKRD